MARADRKIFFQTIDYGNFFLRSLIRSRSEWIRSKAVELCLAIIEHSINYKVKERGERESERLREKPEREKKSKMHYFKNLYIKRVIIGFSANHAQKYVMPHIQNKATVTQNVCAMPFVKFVFLQTIRFPLSLPSRSLLAVFLCDGRVCMKYSPSDASFAT